MRFEAASDTTEHATGLGYADHALARLRRSSGGSITPIPEWLEYDGQ